MDTEVHKESQRDKQPEQELHNELLNVNNECKEKDAPPVPQMKSHKLRRNSRKKMQNALEQVDSDLQEQAKMEPENGEPKKADRRKTRQTRSNKVKSGRVAKPLDLVEVPNGETVPIEKPKLGSDKVQVHIENYPSSEDQDAAVVKNTRRSKRLQSFVEEVRANQKKPRQLKANKSNNEVTLEEVSSSKKTVSPKSAKTNGCIYDDDLGGIEKMGSCESQAILKQTRPLQETPNDEIPSEGGCCELGVTDCRRSAGELAEINTVQESDVQTDPNSTHVESMGCKDGQELDDDSEIDTEQLLRSFKATKRKSFHLEAPHVKRSRPDERDARKSKDADALEKEKTPIQDALQNSSELLFSDVIPPSATQAESKAQYQQELDEPDKISDSGLKSSTSAALSPNIVTTFETPSPRLSVIPQVVSSGLHFTAAPLSDSFEPKKQPSKHSHVSESQFSKADDNSVSLLDPVTAKKCSPGNVSQHLFNTENSLTPDSLLTRPPVPRVEVANSHGSSSVRSSIKTHPKRRKSRRLESSPELDSSGSRDELPSLAQILKRDSSSGRDKSEQEKGDSSDEVNKPLTAEGGAQSSHTPRCPSPDYVNSSQASVDLFGTPEETGDVVPVNNASNELSQFSSEVLVTQQKIEMQKELLRLEKLMALVSEVLHEKENGPENEQKDTKRNSKLQGPQPPNEGMEQDPESNGLQSAARNTRAGPSEVSETSKPNAAKHSSAADTAHKDLCAPASKSAPTSSSTQSHKNRESPSEDKENSTPPNDRRNPKMVLASSGLGPREQAMVKKFVKRIGSRVVSHVTPDVTHIIMHTDEQLVCERTLKYFLGIAGRKWVVSFQWISECFKQKKLVDESLFEVRGDVVNGHNHQGPMRARTTDDDDLLMKGYKIYFQGPFTGMTTDEMGWMVELCGATVVKDPSVLDGKQMSHQLVIVQSGSDISASRYNSLSRVATVVTRGWLLDSVSAYTIQNCKNYTI
uniref:BRCT domain-containing protein n=1 Tax=Neogobius melanostomus TaxID=47308 RepID=A0A8C6SGE4_9GOBI